MRDSAPDARSAASDAAAWRRWSAIEPIFDAALDLPPNERDAYVNAATRDDVELRAAVEQLLRAAERAEGDLTIGAVAAYPAVIAQLAAEDLAIGEQIGPYRIVDQAGEGGMGVVYVAERADDQYRSRVAVKLMRTGIGDPLLVRRFLEERQILASLVHPGIARLYDGGVTRDERPWFAMELVDGTPIGHYCDANRLTIDERLRLMLTVCDAVAYAHRNFVVHRDLKPANILVDSEGRVRIVDFGIAKVVEAATSEAADVPASAPAWTPGYASPELIRGQRVTAASDVYSLGVVLYRLLTGRRPHRVSGRETEDVTKAVLEGDYIAASTMALRADRDMLESRRTSARKLAGTLRGDMDAILLKAMERERDRRYATVDEFSADIRRHLDGRPVAVRPATWWYRSAKFVRRNPIGVATVATVLLLVTAFAFSTSAQLRQVDKERQVAAEVSDFLSRIIRSGNPLDAKSGEEVTMREVLDRALTRLNEGQLKQPAARGRAYADIANAYRTLQRYDRAGEAYDSAVVFDRQAGLAASALRNRIWIAEVLADQGHLVAAESVHRETLAEARLIHGTQSAETAGELARLGDVLVGEGHVEDGERLLRESIVAYERLLARHDPKVSPTSIAGVQLALVRVLTSFDYVRLPQALAQAESIALMALATEIRVRSDSSPLVAGYYSWLARVQHRRGNPAGEQMLRAAHDRHRELWGEEHLRLDVERHALAEMALDRGALARADSLYRGIVERARSRAVRPEGLDSVLMGLGRVRLESGKFAAADTLLREALEWRQRIIPPGDPRIAEAQALLGAALAKQRRYHEAEPLLRAALPIVEKRWGDADRRTLTVRTALEQIQRGAPGAR